MRAFHIPIAFLSIWESILRSVGFHRKLMSEDILREHVFTSNRGTCNRNSKMWYLCILDWKHHFPLWTLLKFNSFIIWIYRIRQTFSLTWHFSHTVLWVQWFLSKWFWWASSWLRYKCYGLWQLIFKLSAGSATVILSFKFFFLCHALALFCTPLLLYLQIPSSISAKKRS